jgi:hypothetical protein
MKADRYTMLLATLPHLEAPFMAQKVPISRLQLDKRLEMLTDADWQVLNEVENVIHWERLSLSLTDADLIARAEESFNHIPSEYLRSIVQQRLELRTIIAALRRRHLGKIPRAGESWGWGRFVSHIQRYWNEPGFRLERVYPWIGEALQLLHKGDALGLERLLLMEAWRRLERVDNLHQFDLTAVVVYVLRWSIIERWSRYQAETALRRFDTLVNEALESHSR